MDWCAEGIMTIRVSMAAAAALLLVCTLCGCSSFFPPEIQDDEGLGQAIHRDFGERPLWPKEASEGYSRRIRVFVFPAFANSRIAIRIDTSVSGETTGHYALIKPGPDKRQPEIMERRSFTVSAGDLAMLNRLIDDTKLWTIYPEHWVSDKAVCLDGVQIILERVTDAGYRYSDGNAICPQLPLQILKVVDHMIDMAGLGKTPAHYWIRNYWPDPGEEQYPLDAIGERPRMQ
jgi:hypothetical protein